MNLGWIESGSIIFVYGLDLGDNFDCKRTLCGLCLKIYGKDQILILLSYKVKTLTRIWTFTDPVNMISTITYLVYQIRTRTLKLSNFSVQNICMLCMYNCTIFVYDLYQHFGFSNFATPYSFIINICFFIFSLKFCTWSVHSYVRLRPTS